MIKKILKWVVIGFVAFIIPGIVLAGCTSETEELIQEAVQEEEKEVQSTIEPIVEPTIQPSVEPSTEPIPNTIEQSVQTNQNNTEVVIKKSNSGICHAPGTTYYDRTLNFITFDSIDECLASGGKLPKR